MPERMKNGGYCLLVCQWTVTNGEKNRCKKTGIQLDRRQGMWYADNVDDSLFSA